jgi:hypothetical protein
VLHQSATVLSSAVIFLHIPKSAGSTLNEIIWRQYSSRHTFSIYESGKFHELNQLPEVRKQEIKLINGHVEFGIHQFLPQPSTYITLLRDPIERAISHYYYVLRTPKHHLYKIVTSKEMGLEEYIKSGITKELDNGQTRLLAGPQFNSGVDVEFGHCTSELLEQAKRNLSTYFKVVGLTEEFDRTLLLLKRTFGWKDIFYLARNVSQKRPSRQEIPAAALRAIEAQHQFDLELYHAAAAAFRQQIAEQDATFHQELRVFKVLNHPCSHTRALVQSLIADVKVKRARLTKGYA